MFKAILLPAAKEDIKEAAHWYKSRQKGLGKRFTKAVREKVKFIQAYPHASVVRYDNTRTTILGTFPYMIHYTVDQENKQEILPAVFHTSRNPEIWKRK